MKREPKSAKFIHNRHTIWLAKMFVRGIGLQKIEEVAITSKNTKDARYVASSLTGRELDALAVKGR